MFSISDVHSAQHNKERDEFIDQSAPAKNQPKNKNSAKDDFTGMIDAKCAEVADHVNDLNIRKIGQVTGLGSLRFAGENCGRP